MDEEKYLLVRGDSGFIRIHTQQLMGHFTNHPGFEIVGRDLTEEEAYVLARIANANLKSQIE